MFGYNLKAISEEEWVTSKLFFLCLALTLYTPWCPYAPVVLNAFKPGVNNSMLLFINIVFVLLLCSLVVITFIIVVLEAHCYVE